MPRNSSGTYALPAGNPVVTNTLIQSTWANTTLSDVSTAMTDSLDRNGRGAMLAALKNVDGTATAPSITFSSEGGLGVYRAAAGTLGFAVGGALVLSLTSTGLTFTTPLVLPVGSAAAPSLTFVANTNTGIYSPTTNQVAITTNGAQRVLVDATGNLAIATGSLTLATGAVVMQTAGANFITAQNAAGTLQLQTGGANTRVTIDAAGRVGIGLTPTAQALEIAGNATTVVSGAVDTSLTANVSGAMAIALGANNSASATALGAPAGTVYVASAGTGIPLVFTTQATERMRIDSAGNVGIGGTALAAARLHVFGGNSYVYNGTNAADQGGAIGFGVSALNNFTPMATIKGVLINGTGTEQQGGIAFQTRPNGAAGQALAERMRIDPAGQVGIGKTPGNILDVSQSSAAGGATQIVLTNPQSSIGMALFLAGTTFTAGGLAASSAMLTVSSSNTNLAVGNLNAGTGIFQILLGGSERVRVDASGNMGIGKTPSTLLDVNGTATATLFVGPLTGNVNGSSTSTTGNAATATALQTARTIGGVSFNGTANITPTTVAAGATDGTFELGWKDIPQNAQTAAYTLVLADRGKSITITTGGVTVPNAVFAAGNVVTITNNSGSNQTITQGASLTMHQAGTANTGNRTLLPWGIATVEFLSASLAIITGNLT